MIHNHNRYLNYMLPDSWCAEEDADNLLLYDPNGDGAMTISLHNGYKIGVEGAKEYRGIKGMRPDFVDFKNATIYELKPNNPRSINQGIKQLQKYNKALGGGFNMVLELY